MKFTKMQLMMFLAGTKANSDYNHDNAFSKVYPQMCIVKDGRSNGDCCYNDSIDPDGYGCKYGFDMVRTSLPCRYGKN